jgi:L-ribulose-5-phosphate 4-epimerase
MTEQEGVVKFQLNHSARPLQGVDVEELVHWRSVLMRQGMIGADPKRYDGYGFGNMSRRTDDGFLITGTQTGERDVLSLEDFAEVTHSDLSANSVTSVGATAPSSESLTHAAVYLCSELITYVFHVHSPHIWLARDRLSIQSTASSIPYGTPEMAKAVTDIVRQDSGIFCMSGHEDGVVGYGDSAEQIVTSLLSLRDLSIAE